MRTAFACALPAGRLRACGGRGSRFCGPSPLILVPVRSCETVDRRRATVVGGSTTVALCTHCAVVIAYPTVANVFAVVVAPF